MISASQCRVTEYVEQKDGFSGVKKCVTYLIYDMLAVRIFSKFEFLLIDRGSQSVLVTFSLITIVRAVFKMQYM